MAGLAGRTDGRTGVETESRETKDGKTRQGDTGTERPRFLLTGRGRERKKDRLTDGERGRQREIDRYGQKVTARDQETEAQQDRETARGTSPGIKSLCSFPAQVF